VDDQYLFYLHVLMVLFLCINGFIFMLFQERRARTAQPCHSYDNSQPCLPHHRCKL